MVLSTSFLFWLICFQQILFDSYLRLEGCGTHVFHDDVIKWNHFPSNWPFVRGIHRWPVNSPHKGQRRGALMFSLICIWTNGWVNNRDTGDLRRHHTHYDVTVWFFDPNYRTIVVAFIQILLAQQVLCMAYFRHYYYYGHLLSIIGVRS